MIAAGRHLLRRVGNLPARPVFAVFHLSGAASSVAAFFHRPIDPHYAYAVGASPAALVAVFCGFVAYRAIRRGH